MNHVWTVQNMKREKPPAFRPYPSKLIVESTTRCNLQCPMCLKNSCRDFHTEADMTPGTFGNLVPAFPALQALVLSGIGEPLLNPHLNDFIRTAKARMPQGSWVGFQSNGLLIDEARAKALVEAGLDRICLSVDTVDPGGYRLIRKGGELSGVVEALQALDAARNNSRAPLKIGIELVLRKDNVGDLARTIRWAGSSGIDFAIVTHLFPYHADLSSGTAYDTVSDVSAAIAREYLEQAQREKIDLRRYYEFYINPNRTDEDRQIVRLVDSMRHKALRQKISLNISSLFDMDLAGQEDVRTAFEEAAAAASSSRLELELPGVSPRRERKCEFVEEGCAFVSVNGSVHPCYQLWHRYHFYTNGVENAVGPRTFGNVNDRGILDVWNDPSYAGFRRNVLRYDYPYCFDCSFALCGNVNTAEFERDCYLNTEPCGACLWCMGMLKCLK